MADDEGIEAGFDLGVVEVPEVPYMRGDFLRTTPYNCKALGHVMEEHWWPKDRSTKYRHCVIPGCKFVQTEDRRG